MTEVLTAELVLSKTKVDNLHSVCNLNLWGNELQDLKLLKDMPNLEVISMSVNKISSLRDFSNCLKLQYLYLRKNQIGDIRYIRHLTKLTNLRVLWLYDNPCAHAENYRLMVIKMLPTLTKLDKLPVTNEERELSKLIKLPSFQEDKETKYVKEAKEVREVRDQKEPKEVKELKYAQDNKSNVKQQKNSLNSAVVSATITLLQQLYPPYLEYLLHEVNSLMSKQPYTSIS